jgi:NTP pyrophosphatase (non-canonical NTP hydrolase)
MNLSELQAELRHFAAERDWQPFHTPKNLSTALMVEAAELAEVFQWMTPEQSRLAHRDAEAKERIGAEIADVLLYLLQVADHCEVDLAQAVRSKLARNAVKYPPSHAIARVSPVRASVPGTHVLLDYENVQPSEGELRTLVPEASQVWVFHGPHQRQVAQRFASFGADVTAVPISKTGKNALDFHLSFYMGYIAARNQASAIVVVANDKGYEPMLAHARSMGFAARQVGYGGRAVKPVARKAAAKKVPAKKAAPKAVAKSVPAEKVRAKEARAKEVRAKEVPAKVPPAKKAPAKKIVAAPAAKKASAKKVAPAKKTAGAPASTAPAPAPGAQAASAPPDAAAAIGKLTDSLGRMGAKRPTKPAPLRRLLKSLLGAAATEQAAELALNRLIDAGVVKVDAAKGVSYPRWGA